MEPTGLLDVEDVARALRLSPKSVRRRIAAGDIQPVRLGRGPCAPVRVSGSELARYLRTCSEVRRERAVRP